MPSAGELRPILPAPANHEAAAPPPSNKRTRVSAACEPCRIRKTRCNGLRPQCQQCTLRSTICTYANTQNQQLKEKQKQVQTQHSAYEQLYGLLKTRSESEARELLRRLRTGTPVEALLRHVNDGDLLIQLHVVPETRRRYQVTFGPDMPAFLLVPDNPYLASPLYDATHKQPGEASSGGGTSKGLILEQYLKPFHAAQVVEPLIDGVTVSQWTSVSNDNNLLQHLLKTYFLYLHTCEPIIHRLYFLGDMASGRRRFCSSLLVNVVLASACQACQTLPNRARYWVPENLHYRFMAEARRLWELERDHDRLTTIQSSIILNIMMSMCGMDKIGAGYLLQGLEMANRMKLFDLSSSKVKSRESRRMREYTAWALFCWQSGVSYYWCRSPFIEPPLHFLLPDPIEDPEWYGGDVFVRYPLSSTLVPFHLNHVTKAILEYRVITNDISHELFDGPAPKKIMEQHVLAAFKERLDAWMDGLPPQLSPKQVVLPCNLRLHIEFYTLHMALFQPHASSETPQTPYLYPPANNPKTASHILYDSKIRFETLVRLYYLRHSFVSYDHWIMYALTVLVFMANEALSHAVLPPQASTPTAIATATNTVAPQSPVDMMTVPPPREVLESTLLLCAQGVRAQARNYYLGTLVYRVFDKVIGSEVRRMVEGTLGSRTGSGRAGYDDYGEDQPSIAENAYWPVPIVKMRGDPEWTRMNSLFGVDGKEKVEREDAEPDTP